MSVTILQPGQVNNSGLGPTKTTYNDDIYMGWLGIGSQIDGLTDWAISESTISTIMVFKEANLPKRTDCAGLVSKRFRQS